MAQGMAMGLDPVVAANSKGIRPVWPSLAVMRNVRPSATAPERPPHARRGLTHERATAK
jgi:hypothetical protein